MMNMRKMKTLLSMLLVILIVAGIVAGCSGNAGAAANSVVANASENVIDENNMMSIIQELTSKKYDGRLAGTEGNRLAAQYISDYFKKIGLENPKGLDNYMQFYKQPVVTLNSIPTLSIADKAGKTVEEFKYVDNFEVRVLSSSTNDIDINAPLYVLNYVEDLDDTNKELKGKMLLIGYALRYSLYNDTVISKAYSSGALGVIAEYDARTKYRSKGAQFMATMIGTTLQKQYNPFINIDSDSFAKLKEASDKNQVVNFKCSFSLDPAKEVPNVIGLLPGRDEKLKDQYIIIGSHLDHVGDNLNGTYNPGALDNASGTAAMMEIAGVLKQSNIQPKKSILLMSFNGEESQMLGSAYYAAHPVYPLEHAVVVNLDMVGSTRKLPLTINTSDNGLRLSKELKGYAKELGIDTYDGDDEDSDHVSFLKAGVPAVTLINNDFSNGYHSPGDTIEDVSAERIEQVVKLVLYYIDKTAY